MTGMRKSIFLILMGVISLGCERNDPAPEENNHLLDNLTEGLCIIFGDSILINHRDIEYYDYSTHTIYLKETLPLFQDPVDWELGGMSFTVYAYREQIYSGILFPAWWSSIPSGAFIQWPSFYPGDMIRIEYRPVPGTLEPGTEDPRDDPSILEALQEYGQYHQGLSLEFTSVQVKSGGKVTFSYTLTNEDSFDYYVLSPDKMGVGLFHYFTNGLYLYNQETGWLQHQDPVVAPDPWNSWETSWLERLNHQTSRTYSIEYEQFDSVPPGTYSLYFRFSGLSHVIKEERTISGGLVWMGDLEVYSEVTIN